MNTGICQPENKENLAGSSKNMPSASEKITSPLGASN